MLKTSHLSCSVGGKKLISGITLSFTPNCLWGIIGPNGAGKTSLLRALSGLLLPAAGDILVEGKSIKSLSRQEISKFITFVPQQIPLHFNFKVKEIVAMGRYAYTRQYHTETDKIYDSLEAVDMARHAENLINELSSGERQRVYIARALVSSAPFVLLDEPTSSLDIRHQLEIWELLKKVINEKRTVIASHHDLRAAMRHCDQIVVLQEGQCIAAGPVASTLDPALIERVFQVSFNEIIA